MESFEYLDIKLNLNHLKEEEKEKIKKVIERDKQLRNQHLNIDRIRELRKEISLIEANSPEIPNEHIKTASFCIRCKQSFSYGFGYIYYSLFGQASECSKCGYKICQQCRVYSSNKNNCEWLCKLCHKNSELKQLLLISGEWIQDQRLARSCANSKNKSKSYSLLSGSQIVQINLEPEKSNDIIIQECINQNKSFCSYQELLNVIDSSPTAVNNSNNSFKNSIKSSYNPVYQKKSLRRNTSIRSTHDTLVNYMASQANYVSRDSVDKIERDQNIIKIDSSKQKRPLSDDLQSQLVDAKLKLRPTNRSLISTNSCLGGDGLSSVTSSNLDSSSDAEKFEKTNTLKSNMTSTPAIYTPQTTENSNKQFKNQISFSTNTNNNFNNNNNNNEFKSFSNANLSTIKVESTSSLHEDISEKFLKYSMRELSPSENVIPTNTDGPNTQLNTVKNENTLQKLESLDTSLSNKPKINNNTLKKFTRTLSNRVNKASSSSRFKEENKTSPPQIFIRLDYEPKSSNLSVRIGQIENLTNEKHEAYDVYVKMYLVLEETLKTPKHDDKETKRKTSVKRNSKSPEFNEAFRYTISYDDLAKNVLRVFICHNDKFGRNKIIGELDIHLKEVKELSNSFGKWYEFQKLKTYNGSSLLIRRV